MNTATAQATAQRMIGSMKLTLTLQPTVAKGTAAAAVVSMKAASFPARANDDRFATDAKLRERQRLLYVAPLDAVTGLAFADPKADDLVQGLEGNTWRVLSNTPLRPDGVVPVYHETVVER